MEGNLPMKELLRWILELKDYWLQELEKQLIIFPDKKGIQQFYNIVRMVNALQPNTVG